MDRMLALDCGCGDLKVLNDDGSANFEEECSACADSPPS